MLYIIRQNKNFSPCYLESYVWGIFSLVLIVFLLITGCGYKFTVKKDIPLEIGRIFIEIFENKTDEVGLESLLTNELIKEITRHSPWGIISKSRDDSTAIIKGEIISLQNSDVFYDEIYFPAPSMIRHIVGTVKLSLKNKEGVTIWSSKITETHDYNLVSDDNWKITKRKEALYALMEKLAKSACQRLTEDF